MKIKLLRDVKALGLKEGDVRDPSVFSDNLGKRDARILLELGAAVELKEVSPEAQQLAREVIEEFSKKESYVDVGDAVAFIKEKFQL